MNAQEIKEMSKTLVLWSERFEEVRQSTEDDVLGTLACVARNALLDAQNAVVEVVLLEQRRQ